MTRFYTNRSDFEQNHWLDSQKSRVVAMLRDIDSVSSTVQSEGLSHLYRSRGEASLGASKPSSTFSQAVDRVDSMLRSAGKIHKDIVQNIDSKFTKGLDKSFQSLNEVNGSKNPYMSKGKYEKTYTTTNYTSNYGYVTQTHTRQVHYSLSDILDGTNSPIPAAQSLYQDRVKNLREQLRQTDQLTDKQIKELESKSDAELVQEFYPTLESDYSQIKNSTWQEENKEALGLVDTGLKILAAVALTAGTVMTGGAALPLALAGGAYLFADGAHSAITGNTLITGTQLNTEERIWAGAEAVVTLATFGSFAAGQSALRAGKEIPTTVQTIGKLAKYADEGVEALQWGSGVLQGDATNATLDYIGGKAFEGVVEGSVKGLQSQLSHIEVSSPSQIQLNARQGQDFVDLQTVEFGKIASKVENNITIKMTVDGVEQKIRVDAIGFDEAGNIRIQEYTTAQSGLKSSRQNILEDLSKYGGTIVGAGKGDFVSGVEIPKGTRIDVVSQKTGNVTIGSTDTVYSVKDFKAEMEQLPHINLSKKVEDGLVSTNNGSRTSPHHVYSVEEIATHLAMFDDGAVKVMSFESYDYGLQNYGATIGHPDGHYVMPKFVYEKAVRASNGNPRVLEELLGLEQGYLGNNPVVIDIQRLKNLRMPSGNEPGAWQGLWEPGGYTQGGIPEAVIDQLSESDYTIDEVFK
ncbi:hypothetical protein HO419_08140 [Streptococcus suis]|nr:hypothetical protein [Streptococcus suis]HEM2824437.1 hypothetical protein [Streptococcus suis]HEM2835248.1 hypothetical protein [Streptococcus suis]HEM2843730.1 hypothetical protein [Streptococcus suis]HEM2847898.1 hypothetical protein [Streptococcus suis]